MGAPLVDVRPAGHTSVGADAHIRPLPWVFPLRPLGHLQTGGAKKAAPTGTPDGPNT